MGGIIRYIDGQDALACAERVKARPVNDWIVPTYTRWFVLGYAVTVLLLLVWR